jgi:hypothetical protein
MMPHGYFGEAEPQVDPKEMPEEAPNMVPPGHFAKVAAAVRDARLSKTYGTIKTQKESACDILDHVVDLGRFVYEAEQTVDGGIAGAGTAITGLLDVVCPLIETRFPGKYSEGERLRNESTVLALFSSLI